jgi:acetyl-CoA acyltransferase 1
MTFGYGGTSLPDGWSDAVLTTKEAEDCLIPMGFTSENVASDYGISRQTQDAFAAESYRRAAAAQKAGKFRAEILPIKVQVVDPKTDRKTEIIVDSDDGIREGVTAESLGKLKPAFIKTGSTHAGLYLAFFTLKYITLTYSGVQGTPRRSLTVQRQSS